MEIFYKSTVNQRLLIFWKAGLSLDGDIVNNISFVQVVKLNLENWHSLKLK